MALYGAPYKQIGTAADGTPIWELGMGFDSEYDSLPSNGWLYRPGQGGGSDVDPTPETWRNLSTGGTSSVDPGTVSNPFYQVGTIGANGEGSSPQAVTIGGDAYDPYRNYLSQVFQNTAGGMGRIQSDPNFDIRQYFSPAPAGTDFSSLIPQANEGIAKLLQANPGLDTRYGWTPWADFNDWNQRQNILFPDEGWGSLFQTIPDAAKDLWAEPGFRQLVFTGAGGAYAGSQAAGAGGAAAGGSAAAGGTAAQQGAGYVGLNPASGAVGLNPAAAGVGFQATPAAVSAFEAGINVPGLAAGGAAGAGALSGGGAVPGGTSSVGGAQLGGAPVSSGSAVTTGAPWLGEKAIAGLTNPITLGVLGGAALGGLGGSKQAGTITVEEGLPDWLMPYAKPALDRYSTEIQNYNVDPYGILPSAMEEFQKTIGGQYLDPSTNKWLPEYFRLGAERVKGSLSPSFGHMQAFGAHSGYNEALSRGLGDFAVGLYGGAYEKERDRQAQFTANAPGFLTGASTSAFAPYSQYLSTIGSLGRKKDEPFFENQFGNILGGAMLGGSLGKLWG